MTTSFYLPPGRIHGERVSLPDDEARHAVRVLRVSTGEEIVAVDGQGGWYRIVLDHVGRAEAGGHVVERRSEVGEPPYRLTLALGIIKNRNRFETVLEKAVELGVHEVVPLVTARTEREILRPQRAERILIAAMKQCGRSRMPALHQPVAFEALIAREAELGLCCHESAEPSASLLRTIEAGPRPGDLTVMVGPEGGFTEDEVEAARVEGFSVVSLGPRRLRTETAAIAAASVVASVYDSR